MQTLWISAHPEPRSLNGSLRTAGIRALDELGYPYQQSDLYAMGWDPTVRATDYGAEGSRLDVSNASKRAYLADTLHADIRAEQAKLDWAELVVVQFPLWWYGMPAILKGWFDRVFVKGYAYGVRDPETGAVLRYGTGGLAGKRALAVVTIGAPAEALGPRGIHGEPEEVLFPLLHGTFWYTGMTPLCPMVVPNANRVSESDFAIHAKTLRERLRTAALDEPIGYRSAAGGDYDENLVLRPGIAAGERGLVLHRS
ncbi:NAD(P)H-dependent oxidoreductase [Tamaricihabitans halophyticus]|nr:NAD(P)H-dependent oxidoreductase [Tamaricihabitans halophyticus]